MALAKTTRPAVTGSIPRPRLFRFLDRARKMPVTWISAPPGAGKTVLIASYIVARSIFNFWYQIDDGDNDLATFFYFMGLAAPKRRRPLPLFTPEYRRGTSTFTRNFFREFYSRLKTPFALVFDNYQEVPVDSELHDVMRDAVGELPQGGRAIFISRSDSPGAFARLRAQRAVEILGWPELRFTETEMSSLIRKLAPNRRKDTIRQLYESADGWAAGLVLLLEHQRHGHASEQGKQPSEVLFDYFAGEIFKKLPPETKEVLLQTAFLPAVTEKMAEELTGNRSAGQRLARLHKQNYFLNRRPGMESTYEYHPLLRGFLLAEAKRAYATERLREIRRRAGGIVKKAGHVEAAAELYRDAEDWEALTELICENARTFMGQGRMKVVEEWISAIPQSIIDETAWLLYWRGMCWTGWGYEDRRLDCEKALAIFRNHGEAAGMFLAWSAVIMLHQSESNHVPLDRWIAELEGLMQEAPKFPSEEIEEQVSAAMLLAVTMRRPHHPNGPHWAQRALLLARRRSNPAFRALTAFNWFLYHVELGDFAKAALVVDEMQSLMRSRDASPAVAVNASMTVVWYESLFVRGSYRRSVSEMLVLAQSMGMFYASKNIALGGGVIGALSNGDIETAEAWLTEMRKDLPLLGVGFRGWYHRFSVELALLREDVGLAVGHQPEMLSLAVRGGMPLQELTALLLSALVFSACKQREEASAHLYRAYEIAQTMRSPYVEFMARTVEAHIRFDNGEEARGLESLQIAMQVGRKSGFVNSQVWIPKIMAGLCVKALAHGIETEYVQMLVRKRKLVPEEPPVDIQAWPWPVKVFTLGHFEILKDDKPLQFSGKVQRKPLALLKALIAFGRRNVREEELLDLLWPDADGDAARIALNSAIHRLRRLLGYEEAIIRGDNELSLDERYCWVDTSAIGHLLNRAESALSQGQSQQMIRLVQRAAELYRGAFLGGDADLPPASSIGDRLRRRLLTHIFKAGQNFEKLKQWLEAVNFYEKGFIIDPCAEDICCGLMASYHRLGRPAEVLSIYNQHREALANRLEISPSEKTQTLFEELRTLRAVPKKPNPLKKVFV